MENNIWNTFDVVFNTIDDGCLISTTASMEAVKLFKEVYIKLFTEGIIEENFFDFLVANKVVVRDAKSFIKQI